MRRPTHRTLIVRCYSPCRKSSGESVSGYSFALAYELISQLRQTSSKAGAVHCMRNPQFINPRADRERLDSIAEPPDEINTSG